MVKPPRTMQPESIDLKKAGRGSGKAFQEDSFHNYMARKISLQRQQFGLIVPPPDPNILTTTKTTTKPPNQQQEQQQEQQFRNERIIDQTTRTKLTYNGKNKNQRVRNSNNNNNNNKNKSKQLLRHSSSSSLSLLSSSSDCLEAVNGSTSSPLHQRCITALVQEQQHLSEPLTPKTPQQPPFRTKDSKNNFVTTTVTCQSPLSKERDCNNNDSNYGICTPSKPTSSCLRSKRRRSNDDGTCSNTKSRSVRFRLPPEETIIKTHSTSDCFNEKDQNATNHQQHQHPCDDNEENRRNNKYNELKKSHINSDQQITISTNYVLKKKKKKTRKQGKYSEEIRYVHKHVRRRHGKISKYQKQLLSRTTFRCIHLYFDWENDCNQHEFEKDLSSCITSREDEEDEEEVQLDKENNNILTESVKSMEHSTAEMGKIQCDHSIRSTCDSIRIINEISTCTASINDQVGCSYRQPDSIIPTIAFDQNNPSINNEPVVSEKHDDNNIDVIEIDNVDDGDNDILLSNEAPYCETTSDSRDCIQPRNSSTCISLRQMRPDLFFMGVVVLVNGYTNPDSETIQRLLHKHGGDLERYETSRVTHIIAEHLSMAKAKMYKRQKVRKPVCYPSWITDSVAAQKLLPAADYIIHEMKDTNTTPLKSVTSFFQKQQQQQQQQRQSRKDNKNYNIALSHDENTEAKTGSRNVISLLEDTNNAIDIDCFKAVIQDVGGDDEANYCSSTSAFTSGSDEFNKDDNINLVSDVDSPDDAGTTNLLSLGNFQSLHRNDDDDSKEYRSGKVIEDQENDSFQSCSVDKNLNDFEKCKNNKFHSQDESKNETEKPNVLTDRYINGKIRTVGTDPNFLESFFAASRLSFIGSYKQRVRQQSPNKSNNALSSKSTRFVLHVDMDCFFAAVVLRNYPQYQGMPVAISHQGKRPKKNELYQDIANQELSRQDRLLDSGSVPKDSSSECATCNYEARKAGITKGMYLGCARALCPNLVVLQYDFEGYEEVSEQVSDILHQHAAVFNGFVEQVSCDEAYMELYVPDDCTDFCDVDDVRSPSAIIAKIAERIREEIFESTQCTATVGVSTNKLLAKLATDHVKPNKSFVVTDHKLLLRSLQLRELNGIGYRLERKLAEENLVTIQDVWDLGDKDGEKELCRILGPGLGKKIFGFCQGKDDRPVQPAARKTIGAECNYGVRFDGPYSVDHMIEGLAKEVEKRMKRIGVKGSQVTLKVKQRKANAPPPPKFLGHGSCHNLSKSQATPNSIATNSKAILAEIAKKMFKDLFVPKEDIRGMGIIVSKLNIGAGSADDQPLGQKSILNWFSDQGNTELGTDDVEHSLLEADSNQSVASSQNFEGNCFRPSSRQVLNFAACQATSEDDEVQLIQHPMLKEIQQGQKAEEVLATPVRPSAIESGKYDDISIPVLSQIHMSQVKALPLDMQRHIESLIQQKIEAANESKAAVANSSSNAEGTGRGCARFRQTNVKRMLQLCAVKTGQKALPGSFGEPVALTQLESLPLEVQLQVANSDHLLVGELSNGKKKRKNDSHYRADMKALSEKRPHLQYDAGDPMSTYGQVLNQGGIQEKKTAKKNHQVVQALFSEKKQSDPGSFYRENTIPLHNFMDENPLFPTDTKDVDTSLIDRVIDFLSICVNENRLADIVVLLRSIRNRNDDSGWNSVGFESISASVNQQVEEKFGFSLDVEWLVSS